MLHLTDTRADIEQAVALLRAGELVAIPTETVYGLAALASKPEAVAKVFAAKGRPADHPLIVHLPSKSHLAHWAEQVPDVAWQLADAFWPGPLTMVLPAAEHVSPLVNGGQATIAVRWADHPLLQAVLDELGEALVAPSANPFGRISPTSAPHILEHMTGRIPAVLDGGQCRIGIESTIIDLSSSSPAILRPGQVSADALAPWLSVAEHAPANAPRVPGALAAHYAPRRLCYRLEAGELATLPPGWDWARTALLAFGRPHVAANWQRVLPAAPTDYAQVLYATLHEADQSGCELILVEMPPATPEWTAVRDRLGRASVGFAQYTA
ncbi:L-threonylcarbamoyladenylate synthase [Crenobacter caeni]|uniref:Threonylcarbamoyl-AMP synthase n=1 Tax=Crenobacter caeni TaxID=2705474 RepID=A0A6B2KS44_9NEIS|nr:L-threonylcarbamoyladenylate synthase [Crenobacter caeni]NDV12978.1 threonylcarbamoyl-AMP synthase [Crenobacter caeni]